ncbi:MAG: peptide-methionine (R)-S-oxide reductase [Deltaproteobacteria bacterium]|nr:MAG: peptide-methionine (R)-S-oxide reductase [Deltaproteobacteria bacterium]
MSDDDEIPQSEEAWRARLTPEQYEVLRRGGTEPPFTGRYWNEKRRGIYLCAGCRTPLFRSEAKYDSGSGWPSFFEALDPAAIATRRDTSHGMIRTEILCARCGGHLGHRFDDGPPPTGVRHCVNSAALVFVPEEDAGDGNARGA